MTPSCGEARPEGGAGLPPRSDGMVCRREGKGASGTEQDHRHSRGEALGHSCSSLMRMAMLPWVPPSRLRSALPLLPGPAHGYAASSARVASSMPRPPLLRIQRGLYGVRGSSGRPLRDGRAVCTSTALVQFSGSNAQKKEYCSHPSGMTAPVVRGAVTATGARGASRIFFRVTLSELGEVLPSYSGI